MESWPGVVATAITVGGLVAIALSTDDPQTKAMVAGAIAGALQPLGTAAFNTLAYRGTGRARRGVASPWASQSGVSAEFSDR